MNLVFKNIPTGSTRLCVEIAHHIPGVWTRALIDAYLHLAGAGIDLYMLDVLNDRQGGDLRMDGGVYLELLFYIGIVGREDAVGVLRGVVEGWGSEVKDGVLEYWRAGVVKYLNDDTTGVGMLCRIARVLHVMARDDELIGAVNWRIYEICVVGDAGFEEGVMVVCESGVKAVEGLLERVDVSGVNAARFVCRLCEGVEVDREVLERLAEGCGDPVVKRRFGVLALR
jgi:hypothetical protein